jgi:quinol monooxygenase YgiN
MFVIMVAFQVRPERVAAFIEASLDDARGSVRDEAGCLRFDVVQDTEDETRVLFYEVYQDKAAFDQHLTMPHFHRWNETVKDWMAEPAQVTRGQMVFMTENAS